jgi:hypothetical protein
MSRAGTVNLSAKVATRLPTDSSSGDWMRR